MGITLAILDAFEYIPVCNYKFIIKVKGMYSSFFRLFTIVLDKPSQPELLLLSKLFIMFFFCYDFEFHSHIGWGPKIFFVCSMKESGQHEYYWINILQLWKNDIKRVGNVYWLFHHYVETHPEDLSFCYVRTHQLLCKFF